MRRFATIFCRPRTPLVGSRREFSRLRGIATSAWEQLRDDLRALAETIDVVSLPAERHGERFVGGGELPGSVGRPLPVVTVWLIPTGDSVPRVVTA
jgi:hypothetical protein